MAASVAHVECKCEMIFKKCESGRKVKQNWAPKFFPFREQKKFFLIENDDNQRWCQGGM